MACDGVIDDSRALTMDAVLHLWLDNGGTIDNARDALAVAYAESRLDPYASSVTCNTGIFQITPNATRWDNHTIEELYNARLNVGLAVRNSDNGTNWRDWDVAYFEGESLRARRDIRHPEPGSTADYALRIVDARLPGLPGSERAGFTTGPITAPAPSGILVPGVPAPFPFTGVGPAVYGPPAPGELAQLDNPAFYNDGYDNLNRYVTSDIPYLIAYDVYLRGRIARE